MVDRIRGSLYPPYWFILWRSLHWRSVIIFRFKRLSTACTFGRLQEKPLCYTVLLTFCRLPAKSDAAIRNIEMLNRLPVRLPRTDNIYSQETYLDNFHWIPVLRKSCVSLLEVVHGSFYHPRGQPRVKVKAVNEITYVPVARKLSTLVGLYPYTMWFFITAHNPWTRDAYTAIRESATAGRLCQTLEKLRYMFLHVWRRVRETELRVDGSLFTQLALVEH